MIQFVAPLTAAATSNDDLIEGTGADDVLAGFEGDDSLFGGAGSDRLDLADSTHALTIDLRKGIVSFGTASQAQIRSFESVIGAGDRSNVIIGNGWTEHIEGGVRDDLIVSRGSTHNYGKILGLGGDDTIIGGARSYVYGGDGNDQITGGRSIDAGDGDDLVIYNGKIRAIDLGSGDDSIVFFADQAGLVTTGDGADLLSYRDAAERLEVTDFDPALDRIATWNGAGLAAVSATETDGADLIVTLIGGQVLRLDGLAAEDLTYAMFVDATSVTW